MQEYRDLLVKMRNFANTVNERREWKTLIEDILQRELSEENDGKLNKIIFSIIRESESFMKLLRDLEKASIPVEEKNVVVAEVEDIGRILTRKNRIDLLMGIGIVIERIGGNTPKEFSKLVESWLEEKFREVLKSKKLSFSNRKAVLGELQVLEAEKIIRDLE